MVKKTIAQASKPERLFLFNDLIGRVGLVQAAILSDLYFWFSKDIEPWRTYENWSSWLCVNRRTIARQVDLLESNTVTIKRKRTRLRGGGLGAYKFSPTEHENSKYSSSLYNGLFTNEFSTNDLGSLERDKVSKPKFQMLYVDSIESLGGLTSAYIVNSLAWTAVNLDEEVIQYYSISSLAKRLNIGRITLKRNLDKLEEQGLVSLEFDGRKIAIELLKDAYQVQEDFLVWLEDVREKRIEAFNQSL